APTAASKFESLGWMKSLDVAPPSVETPGGADPQANPDTAAYDKAYQDAVARRAGQATHQAPVQRQTLLGRVRSLMVGGEQRPGQERILTSPVVLGLVAAFVVLVVVLISLRSVIGNRSATYAFNRAVQTHDDGDYRNAIVQFDEFLDSNPKDSRASKAKVLRYLSSAEQYVRSGMPSWTNALLAEQAMYNQARTEKAFEDESTELGELVMKTAAGLADRVPTEATPDAMQKTLDQAEQAVTLHTSILGKASEALLNRAHVPDKMDQARTAVHKATARTRAIAAMDAALKDKSALGVYGARDRLVSEYPAFLTDRAVADRLKAANDLVKAAVKYNPSRRPAETAPTPEPLGPPTSLVIRLNPGQAPKAKDGPIVYALAEGLAYALDGGTGAPLWHVPVGLSAPFPPVAIPGVETSVLVFDSRHNELDRLDGRTGKLRWRQAIEEPIIAPPLVLGNQAIQAVPSGKLLFIDLGTGELTGALEMGRPLGQTPASEETGQYLYVLADDANLFIVKRDPVGCAAVEYIGHAPGSILCPPARLSKYLIVPENFSLADSRWHVFELTDEGAKARSIQKAEVPGWTWSTPSAQGSVICAVGDRGGVVAFAIGEEKVPLQPIAKTAPDNRASGPAFARARTERELWIASGRPGRYDLNSERGTLTPVWSLTGAGPALAPLQTADKLVVFTQQRDGAPGVELWGVEPTDGSVKWRTVLGAPWSLVPAPVADGSALSTLSTDGRSLSIDRGLLEKGGFIEEPIPKPGMFRLPRGPLVRLDSPKLTVVVPGRDSATILVRSGQEQLQPVNLPSALGAAPLFWGEDLLVPGIDGRVYLIDPLTGASRAEPYVPSYDRDHPVRWLAPAVLGNDAVVLADEVGGVRRITRTEGDRPKLVVQGETDVKATLIADPVATEQAIVLLTGDGRVRALASRDLSPLGAWPLEAPRAVGPVIAGGYTFVADTAGRLIAFGLNGQRLWSIDLEGSPPAGAPLVQGQVALFLARDGTFERRALSDGIAQERVPLGIIPAGGLVALGSEVVVPVGPGTVRVLQSAASGSSSASAGQSRAEK
ncbi:MAG TPA: PQQ-binding-like beta-propeller repeat protein, partial [Isosphaeraceae bacterium]|nr:PQQ-binding-like beta-propeller repeat protein [Isosphaeraceae bacterium]